MKTMQTRLKPFLQMGDFEVILYFPTGKSPKQPNESKKKKSDCEEAEL